MHSTEHSDNIIIPGRLPPHEICFVNALIDDHDGMAVVRTVNAEEGTMEYWVAPGMLDEFMAFISYVRNELMIPMELGDPIPKTTEFKDS